MEKEDNNIQKIEETIKQRKNINVEYKKKIRSKIFENIIIAIAFTAYYYLVYLGSINIESEVLLIDLKTFSIGLLITAIAIFEISYKKENDNLAVHGIEVLILAIITLFAIYMYSLFVSRFFILIIVSISFITIIYFLIKSLIIYFKMQNSYIKSKDDIKEIIKK